MRIAKKVVLAVNLQQIQGSITMQLTICQNLNGMLLLHKETRI